MEVLGFNRQFDTPEPSDLQISMNPSEMLQLNQRSGLLRKLADHIPGELQWNWMISPQRCILFLQSAHVRQIINFAQKRRPCAIESAFIRLLKTRPDTQPHLFDIHFENS